MSLQSSHARVRFSPTPPKFAAVIQVANFDSEPTEGGFGTFNIRSSGPKSFGQLAQFG